MQDRLQTNLHIAFSLNQTKYKNFVLIIAYLRVSIAKSPIFFYEYEITSIIPELKNKH